MIGAVVLVIYMIRFRLRLRGPFVNGDPEALREMQYVEVAAAPIIDVDAINMTSASTVAVTAQVDGVVTEELDHIPPPQSEILCTAANNRGPIIAENCEAFHSLDAY